MKLFWTYFCIVLGTAIIAALTFEENRPDLAYLFATSAVFGTTCILAALHWGTLWPQLRNAGFGSREAWVALALLVPLLILNFGYHGLLFQLIPEHGAVPWVEMRKHGFDTATIVTSLAIFPALAEEVAFRGLLQHWLQAALKPWKAILLASALFTALHFSVLSAPYLLLLGLLLGWAKWKTGSLYPSMAIHFLHNAAAVLLFQ
jgi:membrane protease YdiL (CAAX protease family)